MKLKHRNKLIGLLAIGIASFLNSYTKVDAVSMYQHYISGVVPEAGSYSSAPAYRIYGSEYFADGTILYRQTYNDVTYYSPKPPSDSNEARGESAQYVNWGFWDFLPNHTKNTAVTASTIFRSNEYYSYVQLNKDAYVNGCDSAGNSLTQVKLAKGTILKVKSFTIATNGIEYVYFDTSGTGVYSFNNIGRIKRSDITPYSNDRKQIYFDEVKDRTNSCSDYYDNFKPYKTVVQRYWGSAHDNLQPSTNKVPTSITKCNLGGKSGEWKYLGVSSKGNVVVNPYYPGDSVSFMGNGSVAYYDWRYTPWDYTDARKDERSTSSGSTRTSLLKSDAQGFIDLYDCPTYFDSAYKTKKIEVLQQIINAGVQPVNGGYNAYNVLQNTLSATEWADRVSLLTNPYDETPIFVGQRRTGPYSQPFTYVVPTNDVYLYSIDVYDANGLIVASGRRSSATSSFTYSVSRNLEKGQYYTVRVKIAKKLNDAIKANNLTSELTVNNSYGTVGLVSGDKLSVGNKGNLVYGSNISSDMVYAFQVPEDYGGGAYTIKGNVGVGHGGVDNLEYDNDNGSISINVINPTYYNGDIYPESIKLYDGYNNLVYDSSSSTRRAIVPGTSYKVVYTAKYTGTSLYNKTFNGYNWVDNTSSPRRFYVPIGYSLVRKTGTAQSRDAMYKENYFVDGSGSTSIAMINNATFSFTEYNVVLEHPYLEMAFNIINTDWRINTNIWNDSMGRNLVDDYDVVISNVRIQPNKEFLLTTENHSYNVIYDATLSTPWFVTGNDFNTTVETSININGVSTTFVDVLRPNTVTKDITHTVSGVSVSPNNGPYYGEVVVNYNKRVYETGSFDNNRGVGTITYAKVKNPATGNANDTAKAPYNGANTNANNGGDANNNCLIPRTNNTYNSTYTIYNWNANPISYLNFAGGNYISFYKYNILSQYNSTKSNTETFVIKDVLFRSKYTKDKNLGSDGWVSMLNSSNSIIKAGYGFELKVLVEYKTNALLNNPGTSNSATNGTFVTNLASDVNVTPDVFVEIPGNSRTVLSVNPHDGTKQGLNVRQTKNKVLEGSMHVYEWEYTLKGTSSSGVQSVGRIFIPDNLKDGSYKLSIYTPPTAGVSSQSEYDTFRYSLLCDRKDTYVKVQGSATDDLNSHTIQ